VAFHVGHLVPGIDVTDDPLLAAKPSIIRYDRGIPRSDMFHMVCADASVCSDTKSQNVSCADWRIGSVWQRRWWNRQRVRRKNSGMTSTSISAESRPSDSARRRSVRADLVFWTAAGAVVAALSGPLARWWDVARGVLLDGGLAFVILGPILLLGLNRIRPTRGLVAGFVATNFLLAPLAWAAAWFGWLGLSGAGNWALADAGVVMLVLGGWQLTALRRR
jgi:hypothetical protein